MLDIFLAVFLSYQNAGLAGRKGYSRGLYGLLTFAGYIIAEFIGMMFVLAYKYQGELDPVKIAVFFTQDVSRVLLFTLCGVGAYLLVRYIVERMPDKNANNSNNKKRDSDWLRNLGR